MRDSTALPELLILPTETLVPHEDCDPRRVERLSKRILEEGFLKNPPIIAKIPATDNYVVLDGANRVMAFALAGVPHIVAQLVSYDDPGVVVDNWHHVVAGIAVGEFEAGLKQLDDLQIERCDLQYARQALIDERAVSYVINGDGVRLLSPIKNDKQHTQLQMAAQIVDIYKGKADIFRASNDIWGIQKPYYPGIIALIIFPRLKPEDIFWAASNGERIPSGITRHIIPARALNINIPIGILMADWSLDRKIQWLTEWLMERMGANAIRYYAEATFSFNE